MARTRTFKTDINLSIWDGDEHEFVLRVGYEFTPGFKGSRDEPHCDASAKITSVRLFRSGDTEELPVPAWLSRLIEADDRLLYSLVADAVEQDASDRDDAAEWRAEAARDDAMMEGR